MIADGGMATMWVVPAFDELEHGHACLRLVTKTAAVDEFAFEGGEKALAQSIVEAVPDRAHGGSDPHVPAPLAEGNGGVLTALAWTGQ